MENQNADQASMRYPSMETPPEPVSLGADGKAVYPSLLGQGLEEVYLPPPPEMPGRVGMSYPSMPAQEERILIREIFPKISKQIGEGFRSNQHARILSHFAALAETSEVLDPKLLPLIRQLAEEAKTIQTPDQRKLLEEKVFNFLGSIRLERRK